MTAQGPVTEPNLQARLADGSLAGSWTLDPARSRVGLRTASFWGLVPVKGSFDDLSGEAVISPAGEVSGTIRVGSASINTKNKRRDTHLRSADFFHSDRHPHFVFTAQEVTLAGEGATVTGTLQIREQSRPLTFPVAVSAPGDRTLELDAEVRIDRHEFGLTWNQVGMVVRESTLTVHAVFTRS